METPAGLCTLHTIGSLYTLSTCGFLCALHICEPHLYMARPASTSIQSRAKSIWRTKDDILFTTVCATPRTISGRFLMILSCNLKSFPFPWSLLSPPNLKSSPTRFTPHTESQHLRASRTFNPAHHTRTLDAYLREKDPEGMKSTLGRYRVPRILT